MSGLTIRVPKPQLQEIDSAREHAHACITVKEYGQAIECLTHALSLVQVSAEWSTEAMSPTADADPMHALVTRILIDRAECYLEESQHEKALKDADTVLSTARRNRNAKRIKCEALFGLKREKAAMKLWTAILLETNDCNETDTLKKKHPIAAVHVLHAVKLARSDCAITSPLGVLFHPSVNDTVVSASSTQSSTSAAKSRPQLLSYPSDGSAIAKIPKDRELTIQAASQGGAKSETLMYAVSNHRDAVVQKLPKSKKADNSVLDRKLQLAMECIPHQDFEGALRFIDEVLELNPASRLLYDRALCVEAIPSFSIAEKIEALTLYVFLNPLDAEWIPHALYMASSHYLNAHDYVQAAMMRYLADECERVRELCGKYPPLGDGAPFYPKVDVENAFTPPWLVLDFEEQRRAIESGSLPCLFCPATAAPIPLTKYVEHRMTLCPGIQLQNGRTTSRT